MAEQSWDSIRDEDLLGPIIGQKVVDITENDKDEKEAFLCLHFENGYTLKFPMGDDQDGGFDIQPPRERGEALGNE